MEKEIDRWLQEGKIEEAMQALEKHPEIDRQEELLLLLGELYYKQGKTIEALNKFNAVLRLNPGHKKAQTYVEMINNVLDFYYKDLLNP